MSLSDFIVMAKIGEGAYSSVHKVKRISDGNIYALKKVTLFL
jgi:NIMA (never in mitosis gene a)-related kinase